MNLHDQRWGFGSLADDLFTGRADVLSRAATTLRSVESKASSGRTVTLVLVLRCKLVGTYLPVRASVRTCRFLPTKFVLRYGLAGVDCFY
jgi:hypothetical protein